MSAHTPQSFVSAVKVAEREQWTGSASPNYERSGQHTPGPWKATRDILSKRVINIAADGELIACVFDVGTSLATAQEHLLNTRLISAAPELLEAAFEARRLNALGLDCDDVLAQAISKALGEAA